MSTPYQETNMQRTPELYSFISHRRERNGGFLFNPYLFQEYPLNDFEMAVVEKCDGRTPLAVLPVEMARQFRTDRTSAELETASIIRKLEECFAIKWRDAPLDRLSETGSNPPVKRREAPAGLIFRDDCLSVPLTIIWEVTHACNLGCLHCLSACGQKLPGELTTVEAMNLIDTLAELNIFSMTLGGGEPLVREDIYELIEHCTERNLCVRLSTNGYNVTPETIERLKDLNVFAVQVSVDGLRETHDFLRNRRGAFDRAVNALRLFKDAGYHTFMTVTASARNIDEIPGLLDLAVSLGVSTFKVGPYVPIGRATEHEFELKLSREQIKYLAETVFEKQKTLGKAIDLQTEGLFTWLLDPQSMPLLPAGSRGPGCSAGISEAVVSYDGEVYSCPYMRNRSAGNVRRDSLLDIWNNDGFFGPLRSFEPRRITGKCASCSYLSTRCSGGCRGAAEASSGDLYTEDPFCWHRCDSTVG